MTAAEPTPAANLNTVPHPGYEWLNHAACMADDLAPFFVDAGRVIDDATLSKCRACPVRRQCIIHSYVGGPGGTMIGAGYLGGFSLGQRRQMTLVEALERAELEVPCPRETAGEAGTSGGTEASTSERPPARTRAQEE